MTETVERESMEFDVVIVGAGPSGLASAIRLRQLAEEKGRESLVPQVGDVAPDFTAERLGEGRRHTGEFVTLSKLRGRPVALAFGSYT